jgi:ribosomal protein S18 acetylase RimI-like enzyme
MANSHSLENLVIRNLRQTDQAIVTHIDSLASGFVRNTYFERKFKRIFGEDAHLLISLVAELNGKVVGYVMGEANTGEYGIPEPVASIDTIGIDPSCQRLGIGKLLIEDFCALAAKAGVELMTTLVSENDVDLITFFMRHQFKPAKMVALDRPLSPDVSHGR